MSLSSCKVDGKEENILLTENEVSVSSSVEKESLKYRHVISIGEISKSEKGTCFELHYAFSEKTKTDWKLKKFEFSSVENKDLDLGSFYTQLSEKHVKATSHRPKKLLVLVNPISGGKYGRKLFTSKLEPLFQLAGIALDVKFSERHKHFTEILQSYDISQVDGVVVVGGDGTYSEVMNILLKMKQEAEGVNYNDPNCVIRPLDIPIGFIAAGTGNGMAMVCFETYDPVTAALKIIIGDHEPAPAVACFSGGQLISYAGMLSAHGIFADMVYIADQQRWLSRARYPIMILYCILWRPYRLMEGKVTFINRQKNEAGTEEIQEEVFTETFIGISMFAWHFFDAKSMQDLKTLNSDSMHAFFFRPTSRWSVLRLMKKMVTSQGFNDLEFIVSRPVTDMKFEMKKKPEATAHEQKLESILSVDGEIHDLPLSSAHYRIFPGAVRLYSQKAKSSEETTQAEVTSHTETS